MTLLARPNTSVRHAFVLVALLLAGCAGKKQVTFVKHVLTDEFLSEGIAAGDINHDGKIDLVAGSFWFEAPAWTRHELDTPRVFIVTEGRKATIEESYSNSMLNFTTDVNMDGWLDYVRFDFPGTEVYWYENPKNAAGYWKRQTIFPTAGNESPRLADIDGDGQLDVLCGDAALNNMIWLRATTTDNNTSWEKFLISTDSTAGTARFSHGLGYGDVTGDGRAEVIIPSGWWEPPADVKQPGWKFTAANLGQPCAQMQVFDVDRDGDMDVVSTSAHKRGIWWHENDSKGNWTEHVITTVASETHANSFRDLNGDGIPELITGKRYLGSRGVGDGAHDPAVIFWLELDPEKLTWKVNEVDDNSGVGLNIVVEDLDGDGLLDIATANKKGIFFFEQQQK